MTAQTEPQAVPETGEDDADRRAKEAFTDYRDLLATCKKHNLRVEAGDDWEHPFIKCVAETIRAAVEAEKDRCAVLAYQIGQSHPEAGGREVAAAIRARDEAS